MVQAREIWAHENDKLCAVEDVAAYCSYSEKVKCIYARDVQKTKYFLGIFVCFSFYMDPKEQHDDTASVPHRYAFSKIN